MSYKEELQFKVIEATIKDLPDLVFDKCTKFAEQGEFIADIRISEKEMIDNLGEVFVCNYFKIKEYKIDEFRNFSNLKHKIVTSLASAISMGIIILDEDDYTFDLNLRINWS